MREHISYKLTDFSTSLDEVAILENLLGRTAFNLPKDPKGQRNKWFWMKTTNERLDDIIRAENMRSKLSPSRQLRTDT